MCVFCEIASGRIPAHKIYEDGETAAFLDVNPSAPGHTLVIPKKHYSNIADLPENLVAATFKTAKRVTHMLSKALGTAHFTTGYNMGKLSGQEVDHLHVHVIPRFEGDRGTSIQAVVRNPSAKSLEEMKEEIIKNGS